MESIKNTQQQFNFFLEMILTSKNNEVSPWLMSAFMQNICALISHEDAQSLKVLFSQDFFYKIPKRKVYKLLHLANHSLDPTFRNEIVEFLMKNEKFLAFMKADKPNYPLHID